MKRSAPRGDPARCHCRASFVMWIVHELRNGTSNNPYDPTHRRRGRWWAKARSCWTRPPPGLGSTSAGPSADRRSSTAFGQCRRRDDLNSGQHPKAENEASAVPHDGHVRRAEIHARGARGRWSDGIDPVVVEAVDAGKPGTRVAWTTPGVGIDNARLPVSDERMRCTSRPCARSSAVGCACAARGRSRCRRPVRHRWSSMENRRQTRHSAMMLASGAVDSPLRGAVALAAGLVESHHHGAALGDHGSSAAQAQGPGRTGRTRGLVEGRDAVS